jgi:ABC-type sugar transport system ATPase subunit
MKQEPIIRMEKISKNFGAVTSLTDVDLELYPGEVLGLAGDNGAGKSTLMKILAGVHRPSEGAITVGGEKVHFSNPADANKRGIQMIYQDLAVADNIDVVGNVFLGRELTKKVCGIRIIDEKKMEEQAVAALERVKINIGSVRSVVENLSGGQRQAVAIARTISAEAQVIIMDEPTAALGVTEGHQVIEVIKDLKRKGIAVIFVSHRLGDLREVADRILVLKGSRKVGELEVEGLSREELRTMIVEGV